MNSSSSNSTAQSILRKLQFMMYRGGSYLQLCDIVNANTDYHTVAQSITEYQHIIDNDSSVIHNV